MEFCTPHKLYRIDWVWSLACAHSKNTSIHHTCASLPASRPLISSLTLWSIHIGAPQRFVHRHINMSALDLFLLKQKTWCVVCDCVCVRVLATTSRANRGVFSRTENCFIFPSVTLSELNLKFMYTYYNSNKYVVANLNLHAFWFNKTYTLANTRPLPQVCILAYKCTLYTAYTWGDFIDLPTHAHKQPCACSPPLGPLAPGLCASVSLYIRVRKHARHFLHCAKLSGDESIWTALLCSLVVVGPGACVRWVDATAVVLCCCWQRWLWWWVFVKSLRTPHVQMLEFGSTAHVRTHAQNAPHCECLIRNNTHTPIVLSTAAYLSNICVSTCLSDSCGTLGFGQQKCTHTHSHIPPAISLITPAKLPEWPTLIPPGCFIVHRNRNSQQQKQWENSYL